MIEKLKHKYALSSKGAKDMIRAFVAVTLSNLVLMLPVGLLYVLSSYLLDQQLPKEKLTFFSVESVVILICIALTTIFQYRATFLSTYVDKKVAQYFNIVLLFYQHMLKVVLDVVYLQKS